MSMKKSNDTIGNRTFQLVAQCLNQLRHLVLTVTRKQTGRWWCSNSGKGNMFLSSSILANPFCGPHSIVVSWHHISSLGLERPGRDDNHSPLTIAEVKNVCRCIFTPLICLRSLEWEKLRIFNFKWRNFFRWGGNVFLLTSLNNLSL
jgi:hypothetical protein